MATLPTFQHRHMSVRQPQPFQLHVECLACKHDNCLPLEPGKPVRTVCSACGESLYLVGPVSGHIIATTTKSKSINVEITLFR